MIIRTIANALVQCSARTQAGWITLALVEAACSSLTVRVDMAFPAWSSFSFIRREPAFCYCRDAIRSMHGGYRVHKKASRVAPARQSTRPCWDQSGARGSSGRRHQHGIDHMDHAVGLIDVRDRDHRGSALGVDDPGLAVLVLDRQFFAFGGLELHAVLQVGRGELAGHDMVGE